MTIIQSTKFKVQSYNKTLKANLNFVENTILLRQLAEKNPKRKRRRFFSLDYARDRNDTVKVLCFALGVGVLSFVLLTFSFSHSIFADGKTGTGNISIASGYSIQPVVDNLNGPTAITFDENNNLYLAESGYAGAGEARILKFDPSGKKMATLIGFEAPINGLTYFENKLYVSHRGKISMIGSDNTAQTIVDGLPSNGDFSNNQILFGSDKKLYVTQGTVTNAGVAGGDNLITGWLKENAKLVDTPCENLLLNGVDFAASQDVTGAFVPFGTATKEGQEVAGNKPCNGSVMRIDLTNPKGLEILAWGLRNPVGIGQDSSGKIYFTEQGFDLRGQRLIKSNGDNFYSLDNRWYGWPDYSGGEPVSLSKFKIAGGFQPQFVLQEHPGKELPPQPEAQFKPYSRVSGFAFAPDKFGFKDQAFVALSGSVKGLTEGGDKNIGFSVVRVDLKGRKITDFIANKKVNNQSGPASALNKSGLERPTDVKFNSNGEMYLADFGVLVVENNALKAQPGTGALWKVTKGGGFLGISSENYPAIGVISLAVLLLIGLPIFFLCRKGSKDKSSPPGYFFFCRHK